MPYRLANALSTMRDQVNKHAPERNKGADGWIGDAKHATTNSDHNPWVKEGKNKMGIVTALDITHDPARGIDTWRMAEQLRLQRDPRIKYVISNGRIFSSVVSPWSWRKYTGSNPHRSHIHVSVLAAKQHYDEARPWVLGLTTGGASGEALDDRPASRPVLRRGSIGDDVRTVQRLLMLELVDGDFGSATEREVKAFQRNRQLKDDGIVGVRTWTELDKIEGLPRPFNYDEAMELVGDAVTEAALASEFGLQPRAVPRESLPRVDEGPTPSTQEPPTGASPEEAAPSEESSTGALVWPFPEGTEGATGASGGATGATGDPGPQRQQHPWSRDEGGNKDD